MLAKSISGAAAAASPVFVEDTFSTYLYTGTGSSQTITNGIDLSGKGGLVWIKGRSGATGHRLTDTARGATKSLESNSDLAQATEATGLTAFNGTGFTIGADADYNTNTATYVSWAFRKQAKFFDVVTYTGNGANRTIAHNLGSVPGCIIVRRTSASSSDWIVYHRSLGAGKFLYLNAAFGEQSNSTAWNNTSPTSTNFSLGTYIHTNDSGASFVAYLFAHDAGGFGLTGTDNVISCGSFTTTGNEATINLGYEPQWVLIKSSSADDGFGWLLLDNMRGWYNNTNASDNRLIAQLSIAEQSNVDFGTPTATGFYTGTNLGTNTTYIYIAIRRGPMKVPTNGTSVHTSVVTAALGVYSTGFPVDFVMSSTDKSSGGFNYVGDRLRGGGVYLTSQSTSAETAYAGWKFDNNTGVNQQQDNRSSVHWNFRRAPGFFDVVAYTGNGGTGSRSLSHNLQAVPEFIILKRRDAVSGWQTGSMFTSTTVTRAVLNLNNDQDLNSLYSGQSIWGGQPTSSAFLIDSSGSFNTSAATYIAYLFATVTGVSKVGSYTGTGTTKQIDCGFTGGARFVLIKRTDSTGDWYVWDTARGIVSGNDPYLLLNSTAAEVTNTDYIDTYSAGFEISSTAPAAINANGGTFIFLAIA